MLGNRLNKLTLQLATIGGFVALSAGVASAQQGQETTAAKANTDRSAMVAGAKAENAGAKWNHRRPGQKALFKGINLTKAEQQSVGAVDKKYAGQMKALREQEQAAKKAGTPDAAIMGRIEALRTAQRTELRSVLTPDQTAQFDKNLSTLGKKK